MTERHLDDLLREVRAVIVAVDGLLPSSDLTSAWELVDAGEPGIALENLCTQLFEYDASLEDEVINQIGHVATRMKMDPDRLLKGRRKTG